MPLPRGERESDDFSPQGERGKIVGLSSRGERGLSCFPSLDGRGLRGGCGVCDLIVGGNKIEKELYN